MARRWHQEGNTCIPRSCCAWQLQLGFQPRRLGLSRGETLVHNLCQDFYSPATPKARPQIHGGFVKGPHSTKHSSFLSPSSSPKPKPPLPVLPSAVEAPSSRCGESVGTDAYPDITLLTWEILLAPTDLIWLLLGQERILLNIRKLTLIRSKFSAQRFPLGCR